MRIVLSIIPLIACISFITTDKKNPRTPITQKTDTTGKKSNASSFTIDAEKKTVMLPALNDLSAILTRGLPSRLSLGTTKQGREIEAFYFPGSSDQRALIIGGVHGSELSSIEVGNTLIRLLSTGSRPYYSVIIIPALFPDNAAAAMENPALIGSTMNIGRYSSNAAADPNRQMPSPGSAFNEDEAKDHAGRVIEKENQQLLQLINFFRPSRIASLHAIRQTNYGGVYADPRTDHRGIALGYSSDSSLAIAIAKLINENGGNVAGNQLNKKPTALYYKDPTPVAKGALQKRNMTGSVLNGHRGSGISLGTWGTTAVYEDTDTIKNRPAMRVLTIEFPGAKRPEDHTTIQQRKYWQQQVYAFAAAIQQIFLEDHFSESAEKSQDEKADE